MGDMFTRRETKQETSTVNNQIALQGNGQLAVSGSNIYGNLSLESADAEIAKDAIELAHQGINTAAVMTLSGQNLANNVSALAHASVAQSLATLERSQDRALRTTDEAVKAAQQTAKNSTAIPQSALSEKITQQVLVAAVLSIGLVVFISRKK
jgi:hypothetical protein